MFNKRIRRAVPAIEKSVFISDTHHPYHDEVAVELMLSFLRWYQPDIIFLIGDIVDFYALSSFDKDPNRMLNLQEELDSAHSFFSRLRTDHPNARIVYREGNHEDRLMRYLRKHPELYNLRSMQMLDLLGVSNLRIEHYGYKDIVEYHGFQVEHGDVVRKRGAYTAAAMMEKRLKSGIIGHTHRMGAHYRTIHKKTQVWYENGCLCSLRPEYVMGVPDWQQGFSVGTYYVHKKDFVVEQIAIREDMLFFRGQQFYVSNSTRD